MTSGKIEKKAKTRGDIYICLIWGEELKKLKPCWFKSEKFIEGIRWLFDNTEGWGTLRRIALHIICSSFWSQIIEKEVPMYTQMPTIKPAYLRKEFGIY